MPPEGTLSYELLQAGPLEVEIETSELVDPSRFMPDPDGPDGESPRRMKIRLWYPGTAAHQPQPLLIYSHGLLMEGQGIEYVAGVLASHGYVVAAPDFPLTTRSVGERANSRDVLNHPQDVAFMLDWLLARSQDEGDPLYNRIDTERIAALGFSLGALNTLLLGFHPQRQEPRIKAVISLAGPTELFTRKFLTTRSIPYMAIAARGDAFVQYETNFLALVDKVDDPVLISINGGSHLGFAEEGKWFRWFDHPDAIGCSFANDTIERDKASTEPWYDELGSVEAGYVQEIDPVLCENIPASAMNPLRQQQITLMAVRSFLACQFSADPADRTRWCTYLGEAFERENAEVTVLQRTQ